MYDFATLIKKSDDFVAKIERSLSNAVGDDIKLDIKINELNTANSLPTRIWDFINRNIRKEFSGPNYITHSTKRGNWEMEPIFEKSTGMLYTIMREERFDILRKELPKRICEHYAQALSDFFNKDLSSNFDQISFAQQYKCLDTERIEKTVRRILNDLSIPDNIVKHYAIILFSSRNYELISLKCCVVKSDLSIVAEDDWSKFINISDSSVVESITTTEHKYLNPTNGLKLKQKAKNKIDQRTNTELKKDTEEETNNK